MRHLCAGAKNCPHFAYSAAVVLWSRWGLCYMWRVNSRTCILRGLYVSLSIPITCSKEWFIHYPGRSTTVRRTSLDDSNQRQGKSEMLTNQVSSNVSIIVHTTKEQRRLASIWRWEVAILPHLPRDVYFVGSKRETSPLSTVVEDGWS